MGFFKKDNLYRVTRITGSQDNILDISFADKDSSENNIEVIEWDFPNVDKRRIQTSKEEVLNQVLSGLEWVNPSLETNYQLSKIYYLPADRPSNSVYNLLIRHDHKEFEKI